MSKIIKIIILTIIMLFVLTGCEARDNGHRFKHIKSYYDGELYYDAETGVEYLLKDRGITVLLDADGKPLLYKESK